MNRIVLFIYFFSFTSLAKSQTADFTYSTTDGLYCTPSDVQFTSTVSGNPVGYAWNFGNGTGSNGPNPGTTYFSAGSFTVKLIVIYAQTTVTVTKTVVINPSINASIGYDRNYICKPGVINLNAISNGSNNSYQWDFGDGSGIINTASKTITHNFTKLGVYNIQLLVTSAAGCFDSNKTVITVKSLPITGAAKPASGCIPANVSFNATATIPKNSSITNYLWSFGDGSPNVSTATNSTSHNYPAVGSYTPKVTVTTNEGCTNTYDFGGVAYGTPPFNEIAYPVKSVICGSDAAVLVAKATNANSYHWNFGDGKTATVTDTLTTHKYTTLGTKNIGVAPAYNGCNGVTKGFQVTVIGVIAAYNYSNNCADKKTFSFTNTSQGNLSTIAWDFGDGSPIVNTLNATHTFPSSGAYVTKLTVTDFITGCSDTYSKTIYTADPSLVNADSAVCKNDSTTFALVNTYKNPSAKYTWHVAGQVKGPLNDSTYTVRADSLGNFTNYVIINNGSQYCQDTIFLNKKIMVRGPNLSFNAPSSVCLNDLYTITNNSRPYVPSDSVVIWYWNYGINRIINDTIYQPAPYYYPRPGSYKLKLAGIDINGCKDSIVTTVKVNPMPFLYVLPSADTLCAGNMDSLFAFHSDSITWSPTNGLSCSTCDTVIANPSTTTQYKITAATAFGCAVTDSILVKVYPLFTAVTPASDLYICPNDTVQLLVDPPGKRIVWSPTTGLSNPNDYGPIVSPLQNTTYTATLTDSVGCFASNTSINVHIKSLPTVEAGPDQSYPYNSPFTIQPAYSNNVAVYEWTPADSLSCSACANPSGTATGINTFFIKVTSDSGCNAKDSITIYVECKDANLVMANAFTPNNDNINDYFYPLARGLRSITRFSIYNRFGKLVYEAKNFPPNDRTYGWNGKLNKAGQGAEVFVYYVEALCYSGEKLYKKGSVVLIR